MCVCKWGKVSVKEVEESWIITFRPNKKEVGGEGEEGCPYHRFEELLHTSYRDALLPAGRHNSLAT